MNASCKKMKKIISLRSLDHSQGSGQLHFSHISITFTHGEERMWTEKYCPCLFWQLAKIKVSRYPRGEFIRSLAHIWCHFDVLTQQCYVRCSWWYKCIVLVLSSTFAEWVLPICRCIRIRVVCARQATLRCVERFDGDAFFLRLVYLNSFCFVVPCIIPSIILFQCTVKIGDDDSRSIYLQCPSSMLN